MKLPIFILLFWALLIPLLLGYMLPIWKENRQATKGVVNHDPLMRKFVYKVPLSKKDTLSMLQTMGSTCDLTYTFDPQRAVMTFAEHGSKRDYYFRITEYPDHSILQLEQTCLLGSSSYIPLKLNSFLIIRLSAEPLPYCQYSF